jgi:hypothetical protein
LPHLSLITNTVVSFLSSQLTVIEAVGHRGAERRVVGAVCACANVYVHVFVRVYVCVCTLRLALWLRAGKQEDRGGGCTGRR